MTNLIQTMVMKNKDFIIVALDISDIEHLKKIVDELGDLVGFYKVGMQLFYSQGTKALEVLKKQGKKIFLDLKLNDIPNTVKHAVSSIIDFDVDYLTLFSGAQSVETAAGIISKKNSHLKVLNVTVLTSDQFADVQQAVIDRTTLTLDAGGNGVICSGKETARLRQLFARDFIIVNPGVRPHGSSSDDQKRIVTPSEALRAGATNVVIGRPILQAGNMKKAVSDILTSL